MPKNPGRTRGPSGRFLTNDGNGGGRPKGLAALVQAETRDGGELVAYVVHVLRDARQPTALRLQAAQILFDRGFGKAVQQLEGTMSTTVDATVVHLEAVRAHVQEADVERLTRALLGTETADDVHDAQERAPGSCGGWTMAEAERYTLIRQAIRDGRFYEFVSGLSDHPAGYAFRVSGADGALGLARCLAPDDWDPSAGGWRFLLSTKSDSELLATPGIGRRRLRAIRAVRASGVVPPLRARREPAP